MQHGQENACDILVVGGGAGGCAAALAATSLGYRVIMTEPTAWVGGQLTSQAVPPDEYIWIEQYGCTRRYREFRNRVRQYYRDHYPLTATARQDSHLNPGGGYVSHICFEPRVGVAALDAMLLQPQFKGLLEIRYHYEPVAAQTDGDHIRAVQFRNTQTGAVEQIHAQYVIDASELGDLLPLASEEYVSGAESQSETGEAHAVSGPAQPDNVQGITWCFPMAWDTRPGANHVGDPPRQYEKWRNYEPQTTPSWGGKLLSWTMNHEKTGEQMERALFVRPELPPEWFRGLWNYRKIRNAAHYSPEDRPHEVTLVNWPQNDYFVACPIDQPSERQAEIYEEAKQLSLSLLHWVQTEAPRHDGDGIGYPELYLPRDVMATADGLAPAPYIRESRRIRAEFTVTENHVSPESRGGRTSERFHDTVGIGMYMIDLHPSTNGAHSINVHPTPFQIPMGALIPVRTENLLAGCKNVGTTHITNGCYRLHPIEWNIGEAAGLLAAFSLRNGLPPRAVRANAALLAEFQSLMTSQGFELYWPSGVQ